MKFSCERCGKKYATAESPVPGKVYKLKCKACDHVIVVKPSATGANLLAAPSMASGRPPPGEALRATPAPGIATRPPPVAGFALEDIDLENGPPEPTPTPTPATIGSQTPVPVPFPEPRGTDATVEVSMPLAVTPAAEDDFGPPPGETGYVDMFADGPEAARSSDPLRDDPFAAAPGDPGTGDVPADPFASMRAELDRAARERARTRNGSAPLVKPKVPEIPRPPPQNGSGRAPFVLIGVGVLVLVGILVSVLIGKHAPDPAPAPVRAAAAAPPRAQEVLPAPQVAPEPPPVEMAPQARPATPPEEARPRAVERADRNDRSRKKRETRAEAPQPQSRAAQAAPQPPPEQRVEAKVDLPEESEGLPPETVQRVLGSTRKAFDSCIATAPKSSDLKLDGRKVVLRLTINNNGAVTYPTLDDVTLNGTETGSCLKSAARLMVFPKFRGDPLRVDVPITLGER